MAEYSLRGRYLRWSSRLVRTYQPEAHLLPAPVGAPTTTVRFVDRPVRPLSVSDRMRISGSWVRCEVGGVDTVFYRGLKWLEVRASKIEGMGAHNGLINGLFAARDFMAGEQIGFYDGETIITLS